MKIAIIYLENDLFCGKLVSSEIFEISRAVHILYNDSI
jgi:hypothetical protein